MRYRCERCGTVQWRGFFPQGMFQVRYVVFHGVAVGAVQPGEHATSPLRAARRLMPITRTRAGRRYSAFRTGTGLRGEVNEATIDIVTRHSSLRGEATGGAGQGLIDW